MAYCVKCGAQLADNARFCNQLRADQGRGTTREQAQPQQYGQPFAQPAPEQPVYQQQGYTQASYFQQPTHSPAYAARQAPRPSPWKRLCRRWGRGDMLAACC